MTEKSEIIGNHENLNYETTERDKFIWFQQLMTKLVFTGIKPLTLGKTSEIT